MDRSIDDDPREGDDRADGRDDRTVGRDIPEPSRAHEIASLRERIDSITKDHPSFSELLDRLQQLGIRPAPSIQKSGRLNGFSYDWNGVRYRGSDLGRAYTASGLQKSKGVRYDPQRDDGRLRDAEMRSRERPERRFGPAIDLRDRSQRAREYDSLSDSERAAMREVGRFRAVLVEDLIRIQYRGNLMR